KNPTLICLLVYRGTYLFDAFIQCFSSLMKSAVPSVRYASPRQLPSGIPQPRALQVLAKLSQWRLLPLLSPLPGSVAAQVFPLRSRRLQETVFALPKMLGRLFRPLHSRCRRPIRPPPALCRPVSTAGNCKVQEPRSARSLLASSRAAELAPAHDPAKSLHTVSASSCRSWTPGR